MSDTVHTVDELVSYIKKSNYFKKYGQTENMIVDGLTIFPIMVFPDSIDMRLILEATEKSANLFINTKLKVEFGDIIEYCRYFKKDKKTCPVIFIKLLVDKLPNM